MWASLMILAAGMGSRYGWLKQIDEFGPHGESLLEYAVYDALQAGFDHMVFIIREDFVDAFREKFKTMLDRCPKYDLVFQEMNPTFPSLETVVREKPWGTLHAMLSASYVIQQPFGIINADDRYGTQSYTLLFEKLTSITKQQALLVWYVLGNTLSDHGTVNRGVCKVDAQNHLVALQERYKISLHDNVVSDKDGYVLSLDDIVAMNFMWFHHAFLEQVEPLLHHFVANNIHDPRCEMPITDGMDILIRSWSITCEVIQSPDSWQGVTNPEDKPKVQKAFDTMIREGVYPPYLWN